MASSTPIISLASTKGGVGKTTLAFVLASAFARRLPPNSEYRVACIDADPRRMLEALIRKSGNPGILSLASDVEALLENAEGLLKPGFFVKARVPSGKVDHILAAPREALQYSYGVYKVCLIQGEVLKETEVKIGELSNDQAEIVSGTRAGDMIAVPVKGQLLKDGARIQIVQ